jgi:hypothetical protein
VAHLSPDTPAVDVAVAPLVPGSEGPLTDPGPDLVTGLAYGTVSDVADLSPGTYAVSVRAAGSHRTLPPVLSARVEVAAGAAATVTLGGHFADLALQTLSDDLSGPPPGSARVRVLAAAGRVAALDVAVRGGPSLTSGLPFGAAGESRSVPAGAVTLTVGSRSGAPAEMPVELAAGSVVTLVVLDGAGGGLTVRPVVDAAGPAIVPAGGVEAGTGDVPDSPGEVLLAGAMAVVLAATRRRGRLLLAATGLAAALGGTTPGAAATAEPLSRSVVLAPEPRPAAAPVRLVVPAAGVDASIVAAGLDLAGALVPPADPALAGWYAGGPVPGETGPAVITGHVDWAGAPAVFAGLADLEPGTPVLVDRADGSTVRFSVTRVVRLPKSAFPTAEVYAPSPGAELRLITCGGAFDRERGSYEDNVVVFAQAS